MCGTEDQDRFIEDLYKEYFNDLLLFCRRMYVEANVADPAGEAENCVHEVFMKAYKEHEKLIKHPDIERWLFKACVYEINNVKNKYWRRDKRHEHDLTVYQDEKHSEKPDFADPLDSIKKFEEDESFQDVKDRLYQALMNNQRTTFDEFYVKGESIKQINEKFGIPIGTIKSTLMRIRNRLKAMGIDKEQY